MSEGGSAGDNQNLRERIRPKASSSDQLTPRSSLRKIRAGLVPAMSRPGRARLTARALTSMPGETSVGPRQSTVRAHQNPADGSRERSRRLQGISDQAAHLVAWRNCSYVPSRRHASGPPQFHVMSSLGNTALMLSRTQAPKRVGITQLTCTHHRASRIAHKRIGEVNHCRCNAEERQAGR